MNVIITMEDYPPRTEYDCLYEGVIENGCARNLFSKAIGLKTDSRGINVYFSSKQYIVLEYKIFIPRVKIQFLQLHQNLDLTSYGLRDFKSASFDEELCFAVFFVSHFLCIKWGRNF